MSNEEGRGNLTVWGRVNACQVMCVHTSILIRLLMRKTGPKSVGPLAENKPDLGKRGVTDDSIMAMGERSGPTPLVLRDPLLGGGGGG